MRKSILILLFALLGVLSARADDFKVDGIYYNILSGTTDEVEVTRSYENSYTGSVVIPATVTYNGTTYTVTSIGDNAFWDCSDLTSVTIPESVTSIGAAAFLGCNSMRLRNIPESVTHVGADAFYGTFISNPLYNSKVFAYMPTDYSGEYAIPSDIQSIAPTAFRDCSGLTSVTIPESVATIGYAAFRDCSGLTSVTIPESVTSIEDHAFYGTSISSPLYSSTIFAYMPTDYSGEYEIHSGIQSIAGGAFWECTGLTSVTIPESVDTIGYAAFYGTSISNPLYNSKIFAYMPTDYRGEYEIPSGIQSIAGGAFGECTGLTSVTISESVVTIGYAAFYDCTGLTTVTIGNGVTSIGEYAFDGCSGLMSVTIGKSVTSIGIFAFSGCSGLTSVISMAKNPPYCGSYVFSDYSATLLVPRGSKAAYQSTEAWSNFTRIYESGFDGTGWVTVQSNDTSMGRVTGGGEYEIGEEIMLEAIPNEGYHFIQWSDGNTDNPRLLTVAYDITLTAIFSNTYTVTVQPNNTSMGRVTGGGEYEIGEEITMEAIPNEGYHFVKWSDENTDNPRTLTVMADITLTAIFEKDADPTANENLNADNFRVYVQDRTIYLSEDRGVVQVYNMAGQCVYNGHATAIPVQLGGVYVLVAGTQRVKVLVK